MLISIIYVLLLHWLADFILQTDWMAINKSTNNEALIVHASSYSIVMLFGMVLYTLICGVDLGYIVLSNLVAFGAITFAAHTVTDYYTSRLNSKLWKEGKRHEFFVSIGFDQVLHYVQLFLCFKYLLWTS